MSAAAGRLLAGIDVGGTKILGVLVDPDAPGAVVDEARVPTPDGEEAVLDAMAETVRRLAAGAAGAAVGIGAVGVGIAGLVDRAGILRLGPNLPGLHGVRVGDELARRLSLPVRVDNDATCAAWGEHLAGAARGVRDVACVTLGTGIGGGIIADGDLVRGARGYGAEFGHMVVDPHGPQCPCGRRGCWERFASGSGLAWLAREAAASGAFARGVELAGSVEALRGEHVTAAAAEGDEGALAIVGTFVDWVALGIGNLVAVLDCSLVVIGGGLVEVGDLLLDPVREAVPAHVMGHAERELRIVAAELGEHAGAIGAALLGGREVAELVGDR